MLRLPAHEPTPCGSPTILPQTKKVRRLFTQRCRRVVRTWFVTFWRREPIPSSSMRTERSRSICLTPAELAALLEPEAEAEIQRLLPPLLEPEVVAPLGVVESARQSQPR